MKSVIENQSNETFNLARFVLGNVKREFRARYKNSSLGATWAVLQPLSMILIYTIIFSKIMNARLPGSTSGFGYSIYLCSGIILWGLFSELVSRGVTVYLENGNLIKKIRFPIVSLPMTTAATALINFGFIFLIFMAYVFMVSTVDVLLAPAALILILLTGGLGLALGYLLGLLNVFVRDVQHFSGILLQIWFWATPIVYLREILPDSFQSILQINPLTPVIEGFHQVFVFQRTPDWSSLWYPSILLALLGTFSILTTKRRFGELVDEL